MLLYIIYLVLAPFLWALLIVASLFQSKIRKNYYSFYSRLQIIKKHLKDIIGKTSIEDIVDSKTGEIILEKDSKLTESKIKDCIKNNIKSINLLSN